MLGEKLAATNHEEHRTDATVILFWLASRPSHHCRFRELGHGLILFSMMQEAGCRKFYSVAVNLVWSNYTKHYAHLVALTCGGTASFTEQIAFHT